MSKPHALQLSEALYAAPETGAFPEDIEAAADELRRLSAIEEAAKNLIKVKGRFHTEQAFNQLKELLA
jgi:hypothetical protein